MNINTFLKKIKKTKTELALELGISRPTLNQYIEMYENGNDIENERYNIIFQRLFSNFDTNREAFDRQLESIKFLLERDRRYDIGTLDPEAADIVARIHNKMVADMSERQWGKKIYDAILILLSQYRIQPVMRELMGYFSDLNSDSDLDNLPDESKAYYSYYYKVFREIVNNPPVYNEEEYESFLKRKAEISKQRMHENDQMAENVKKVINDTLMEVQLDYQTKGIEASENEIMNEIFRRIKR